MSSLLITGLLVSSLITGNDSSSVEVEVGLSDDIKTASSSATCLALYENFGVTLGVDEDVYPLLSSHVNTQIDELRTKWSGDSLVKFDVSIEVARAKVSDFAGDEWLFRQSWRKHRCLELVVTSVN